MSTLDLNYSNKHPLSSAGNKKHVYMSSTSGMCDRLFCLVGSQRIAKQLGRAFAYYWPSNSNLNCGFNDLFENQFEVLNDDHIYNLLHTQCSVIIHDINSNVINDK